MAKRRSLEDVLKDAATFAKKKPFTAQELAAHLGVTPNRARQVLEELSKSKVAAELGKRNSLRGKPATLWGVPGTKLSEADMAARAAPRRKARAPKAERAVRGAGRGKAAGAVDTRALDAAVARLEALIDQVLEDGVVVEGPGGIEFTVRLGGARPRRGAAGKRAAGRKAPGRKKAPGKAAGKKRVPRKAAAKKRTTRGKRAPAAKAAAVTPAAEN